MLISTIVFLFFLFATYALFLLASRKSDAHQARLQQRVAEALEETTTRLPQDDIQITREDSIGGSPFINELLSSLNLTKKLDTMLRQADMEITVTRLLVFCAIAGMMAGLAAYTVLNTLFAAVIAAVAAVIPILYVARKRNKRLLKFNSQLPDTLDLLSRSLSVRHAHSKGNRRQPGRDSRDGFAYHSGELQTHGRFSHHDDRVSGLGLDPLRLTIRSRSLIGGH